MEIHQSTNSYDFVNFLTNLQSELKPEFQGTRVRLILDK